ncbi:hypothetical protein [Streptomyces sp. NPDC091371]|uniref:hypothetical protein n=1 Tax=Streptomyces sp. NPDC091371 TaxID=3155303 RepID=UPI00341AC056
MTDHPAAAAAAALIRDLAEATSDARDAYASHADIASVTGSLLALSQHLEDVLDHLARHIDRHDDDWTTTDGERRLPRQVARDASNQIRSAQADAHNMARALARSAEALGHLKPAT